MNGGICGNRVPLITTLLTVSHRVREGYPEKWLKTTRPSTWWCSAEHHHTFYSLL